MKPCGVALSVNNFKNKVIFVLRKEIEPVKTVPENLFMFFKESSFDYKPCKISEPDVIGATPNLSIINEHDDDIEADT